MKKVKKANDILNKAIGNIIKEIDKEQSDFAKASSDTKTTIHRSFNTEKDKTDVTSVNVYGIKDNAKPEHVKIQKETQQIMLSLLSKKATCCQSCITKVTAGTVREAKFGASQARRVIVKALGAKSVNGESALLDAIEESAAYEAEIELR